MPAIADGLKTRLCRRGRIRSRYSLSPPRPGHDHIDFPAAAFGTDQPLTPIRDRHFGAVALRLLGRIGLYLLAAIAAPNDETNAGRSRASERSGRTRLGFQLTPPSGRRSSRRLVTLRRRQWVARRLRSDLRENALQELDTRRQRIPIGIYGVGQQARERGDFFVC